MPLNIRWSQRNYLSIALMLFGACGIFQVVIIFIAQYFLSIGNTLVIVLIPIGVTVALYYCSIIIFDSFAQVERRRKIKSQFQKSSYYTKLKKFLYFPIIRPLLIIFTIFIAIFLASFSISFFYLNNTFKFGIIHLKIYI